VGVASAAGKLDGLGTENPKNAGALSAEGCDSNRCLLCVGLTRGALGTDQVASHAVRAKVDV
jgi:hypothetical protein